MRKKHTQTKKQLKNKLADCIAEKHIARAKFKILKNKRRKNER